MRQVAAVETIEVTNHGERAALIVAPGIDPLADLLARGRLRPARRPLSSLRSTPRRKATKASEEIVADLRGRW